MPLTPGAAHATLARGCAFLAARAAAAREADLLGDVVAMRLTGNRLRELDRFLALIVEAAAALVLPDHDPQGFARLRNTPNKLRRVRAALGLASPDHDRLRGVGRLRDRLHHGAGRGERAVMTGTELVAICALYGRVGDDLMQVLAGRHAASIDFGGPSVHIAPAIVACDGMIPIGKSFPFTLPALPVHLPADHIFS